MSSAGTCRANLNYHVPTWISAWWRPWMSYLLAFAGFSWAGLGYYNEFYNLGLPKAVFNRHAEVFAVVVYGLPLIFFIRDRYQKIRMIVLVSLLFTFWYLIPVTLKLNVNLFGLWPHTDMPSFEVPGTWTNLAMWGAALLFGRRIHCGWMNTCVALKETVGAPFRKHTLRGENIFWLAKVKLLWGAFYIFYFLMVLTPRSLYTPYFPGFEAFRSTYIQWFWSVVCALYFSSLYLSPFFGNRIWCRWLCPFMLGWANVLGFFRLVVDKQKCTRCGLCEKHCDFGLPIVALSDKNPRIRTTECMGCGRCRTVCPHQAISYRDVRDVLKEGLQGLRRPAPAPDQEAQPAIMEKALTDQRLAEKIQVEN